MTPIFGYSKPSDQLLTEIISTRTGKEFKSGDLIFGPITQYSHDGYVTILVESKNKERYIGSSSIRLKRVDIGHLFRGIDIRVSNGLVTDLVGLLPEINRKYKLNLTEKDIHNQALGLGFSGKVDIIIRSDSLLWTGKLSIEVLPPAEIIDTIIIPGTWADIKYHANTDPTKAIAELKYGVVNAIGSRDILSLLELGDIIGNDGATGIWITTYGPRIDWTINSSGQYEFNLYGSIVEYNGPNEGVYSTSNPDYSKICVIRLGDYCSNLTGRLVLGYN
jgi:hypothetical protein